MLDSHRPLPDPLFGKEGGVRQTPPPYQGGGWGRSPCHGKRSSRQLIVGLLLLLSPAAIIAEPIQCESQWQLVDRVDPPASGHTIYKCRPADSAFDAYRLEAEVGAPVTAVAGAARAEMADPTSGPKKAEKTIVRDQGDEVVVYTYAHLPLVSDRDVTTSARQSADANGVHRLEWHATGDEGPAPREGVVRIEKSSGSWTFTSIDGAHTRAVYESHSDLAGSVPAWLINSMMTEAVVDNLARLRTRVEHERKSGGD